MLSVAVVASKLTKADPDFITQVCQRNQPLKQTILFKNIFEQDLILRQTFQALKYCHDNDIIHRDIKVKESL